MWNCHLKTWWLNKRSISSEESRWNIGSDNDDMNMFEISKPLKNVILPGSFESYSIFKGSNDKRNLVVELSQQRLQFFFSGVLSNVSVYFASFYLNQIELKSWKLINPVIIPSCWALQSQPSLHFLQLRYLNHFHHLHSVNSTHWFQSLDLSLQYFTISDHATFYTHLIPEHPWSRRSCLTCQ